MVQNHMLQLLALIAMEPQGMDTESIRDEKVKVLRSLKVAPQMWSSKMGPICGKLEPTKDRC